MSGELTIREGQIAESKHQLPWLIMQHYLELATDPEIMVLKPDWERYELLQDAGKLFTLFAYEGEQIVGYSNNIIDRHLHYDLIVCSNDVIFIDPAKRGTVGRELIARTKMAAKDRGAGLMLWHAKPNTALAHIMKDKFLQDTIYSERL